MANGRDEFAPGVNGMANGREMVPTDVDGMAVEQNRLAPTEDDGLQDGANGSKG